MSIEIKSIHKQFGQFTALNNINLEIPSGELVALLGPSGCGKTSLLRIIAGLETPDAGSIHFYGENTTARSARERQVGFVFQHYALFRHMTVFENVAFGLRVRPQQTRPSDLAIQQRVHALLNLVQLDWLADRYPPQLSGGQRQRIALARALAVEPKVLLLDEPFGALDAKVRKELRTWLRRLHDDLHITSVFVTHDQEEALEVADRIVVMHQGNIEQIGSPLQVYDHPATPFVAHFLGDVNIFKGYAREGHALIGESIIKLPEQQATQSGEIQIYVRPHDIEILPLTSAPSGLKAVVKHINIHGALAKITLTRTDNQETINAALTRERYAALSLALNATVSFKAHNAQVIVAA